MSLETFRGRWPKNIRGRFYVDRWCLDCDLCRETAPWSFTRDDEAGNSFVYRQPTTPDEVKGCLEAVEGCPQGNVHDDGSSFDWDAVPPDPLQ
ncbi:MAG: ferredoxin [Verrucomicrobiales bacterium]|nr:ferredoxin [Verrucomicrobiales bacterium]MCC7376780.1 ferredoxin [Verrucomicrobiales bacterium]